MQTRINDPAQPFSTDCRSWMGWKHLRWKASGVELPREKQHRKQLVSHLTWRSDPSYQLVQNMQVPAPHCAWKMPSSSLWNKGCQCSPFSKRPSRAPPCPAQPLLAVTEHDSCLCNCTLEDAWGQLLPNRPIQETNTTLISFQEGSPAPILSAKLLWRTVLSHSLARFFYTMKPNFLLVLFSEDEVMCHLI